MLTMGEEVQSEDFGRYFNLDGAAEACHTDELNNSLPRNKASQAGSPSQRNAQLLDTDEAEREAHRQEILKLTNGDFLDPPSCNPRIIARSYNAQVNDALDYRACISHPANGVTPQQGPVSFSSFLSKHKGPPSHWFAY